MSCQFNYYYYNPPSQPSLGIYLIPESVSYSHIIKDPLPSLASFCVAFQPFSHTQKLPAAPRRSGLVPPSLRPSTGFYPVICRQFAQLSSALSSNYLDGSYHLTPRHDSHTASVSPTRNTSEQSKSELEGIRKSNEAPITKAKVNKTKNIFRQCRVRVPPNTAPPGIIARKWTLPPLSYFFHRLEHKLDCTHLIRVPSRGGVWLYWCLSSHQRIQKVDYQIH